MSLNADPISGSIEKEFPDNAIFINPPYRQPQERILIDGTYFSTADRPQTDFFH
jgi:hypothetical protein